MVDHLDHRLFDQIKHLGLTKNGLFRYTVCFYVPFKGRLRWLIYNNVFASNANIMSSIFHGFNFVNMLSLYYYSIVFIFVKYSHSLLY